MTGRTLSIRNRVPACVPAPAGSISTGNGVFHSGALQAEERFIPIGR